MEYCDIQEVLFRCQDIMKEIQILLKHCKHTSLLSLVSNFQSLYFVHQAEWDLGLELGRHPCTC
jgi:hypothetical protein